VDEIRNKDYRRIFNKAALEADNEYFKNKFDLKTNSVKKLWDNLNTVFPLVKRSLKNQR